MKSLIEGSTPLEFISDEKLARYIEEVIKGIDNTVKTHNVHKNVVDPFSAFFDSFRQDVQMVEWLEQEKVRQIQKSLQNMVGDFHQKIIGSIEGWENLGIGGSIDLRCRGKKVIAEIKNKHNTMNSSSALAVYDKLQRHLDYDESYAGYTAFCVTIIPKTPRIMNITFHPSERGISRPKREDVRIIDGKSFYQLATGDPEAVSKLYVRICLLAFNLDMIKVKNYINDGVFEELFKKAYINRV